MYSASFCSSRKANDTDDLLSGKLLILLMFTPLSCKKCFIVIPTLSLPISLMKLQDMPERPKEISALNVEPPGTAAIGCSFLNIMSRPVSPIPITLRINIFEDVVQSSEIIGTLQSNRYLF